MRIAYMLLGLAFLALMIATSMLFSKSAEAPTDPLKEESVITNPVTQPSTHD